MEGYDVVTSNEQKVGHVVGTYGDNLIVEQGTLLKSKRVLPRAFAHVDEDARVVRTTVSKYVLQDAPKVDDGEVDETAVARHYGLAGGETTPETLGQGELNPDDPSRTAEDDERAAGLTPAPAERAHVRESLRPGAEEPNAPRDLRFPVGTEPTRDRIEED
jgi:hypothetical protein